jgi:hypothetical protein
LIPLNETEALLFEAGNVPGREGILIHTERFIKSEEIIPCTIYLQYFSVGFSTGIKKI